MQIINKPLSFILVFFANLFGGNFAAAVFLFTLLINVILIPLSIKSQKSSVQQTRIKPKLDELKKRYGDDKQKYAAAQQKLYQEEGVSMSGGCLPMIIRLALMLCIYWLILSPLTYMAGVDSKKVKNVETAFSSAMTELEKKDKDKYEDLTKKLSWSKKSTSSELILIRVIRNYPGTFKEVMSDKEYDKISDDLNYIIKKDADTKINYKLFGSDKLDLTLTPDFDINIFSKFAPIWLIPIFAFLAQMLTSVVSMMINKKMNPDAPTMAGMMLLMPLISLWLGFTLPAGVGFYWICSSLIGGAIQSGTQVFYGPHKMLAKERCKELKKRYDFEQKQLEKTNNAAE